MLIRGESGTGKEVVARAIHAGLASGASGRCSRSTARPCSENLLESELFGHEKGAFTGADKLRRGRFELADGGTLLLDEISEIAPSLQAKLLRVLQESTFERVGSSISQQVDVRVIATTNRDLETTVAEGKFRAGPVLPAQRRADRAAAAARSGRKTSRSCAATSCTRSPSATARPSATSSPRRVRLLQRYPWPGNVRELQNIIERATRAGDRARRRPRRDDRAVAQAAARSAPAASRGRRPRRQAAGGHREAGDPQHARAVQGSPREDRRRAGHRRADARG